MPIFGEEYFRVWGKMSSCNCMLEYSDGMSVKRRIRMSSEKDNKRFFTFLFADNVKWIPPTRPLLSGQMLCQCGQAVCKRRQGFLFLTVSSSTSWLVWLPALV